MQQQRTHQQRPDPAGRLIAEIIENAGRSLALSVEVFLHRGFGSRYISCGFFGVILMFLFSLWFPGQNVQPLLMFAGLYGVCWLVAVLNALIRHWRGQNNMHSLYTGRPFLGSVLPRWKELNVKQLESLAVVGVGFLVRQLNRPLGDYLLLAASFVFVRGYSLAAQLRNRAVQMNDSAVEQQMVAERFREMQEL
ncbi:MAG TPA: hypothetical protein VH088_21440 [Terriglobales bacterium]|jgi:hypothetical protein|nr:hypothetical protein [Terriglobales bacterium]